VIFMELYMISGLVFVSVYTVLMLLAKTVGQNKLIIRQRLRQYSKQETVENAVQEELNRPLRERIFKPMLKNFSLLIEKFLPHRSRENLKNKLLLAGSPGNLSPNEFAAIRYAMILIFAFAAVGLSAYFNWEMVQSSFLFLLGGTAGYAIPELYLLKKRQRRESEIQKTLPDVLDLLTVSVEAGLGFDAALAKVVEKMDGILSDEFSRVLQEIKMGKPRKEALRDLNRRTAVEELSNFISSIIQADQLGVSIGGVLRLQAKETRQKRRQLAEERAMKAPVKMVIPLVLFIFPSVFIVILGPALLQIFDVLMKR